VFESRKGCEKGWCGGVMMRVRGKVWNSSKSKEARWMCLCVGGRVGDHEDDEVRV
jgi:hypothetical protein